VRPNDQRNFVHKKIGGFVSGAAGTIASGILPSFIPGGGVARDIIRGVIGGRSPTPSQVSIPGLGVIPSIGGVLSNIEQRARELGITVDELRGKRSRSQARRLSASAGPGGCEDPRLVMNEQGFCEFPGGPAGGQGEAVKGEYGAGFEPTFMTINVRDCIKGYVLGDDAICYKKPLAAHKRMWPPGRKPLITGGELNAISTASKAATKLKANQKRLEKLGFMKKPVARRAPSNHAHARPVPAVSIPRF